jgi:MioC protein
MQQVVRILVGTTTGNTQYVAEEAQFNLDQAGVEAEILPMDELESTVFVPGLYLICVSTYGYGDVPANAQRLYTSLVTDKPDLSGVRYGLIALGDSSHAQTFCFGGRRFDQILQRLGAQRVGEVLNHDASSGVMPEEAAAAWIGPWYETVRDAALTS